MSFWDEIFLINWNKIEILDRVFDNRILLLANERFLRQIFDFGLRKYFWEKTPTIDINIKFLTQIFDFGLKKIFWDKSPKLQKNIQFSRRSHFRDEANFETRVHFLHKFPIFEKKMRLSRQIKFSTQKCKFRDPKIQIFRHKNKTLRQMSHFRVDKN